MNYLLNFLYCMIREKTMINITSDNESMTVYRIPALQLLFSKRNQNTCQKFVRQIIVCTSAQWDAVFNGDLSKFTLFGYDANIYV